MRLDPVYLAREPPDAAASFEPAPRAALTVTVATSSLFQSSLPPKLLKNEIPQTLPTKFKTRRQYKTQ